MMRYVLMLRDTDLGRFLEFVGALFQMTIEGIKTLFREPPSLNSIMQEIKALGVKSMVIVIVAALATGLVMALQFGYGFARFGAKLYVPKVVTISIVRELGPIFTALMLAGRVGAGIAAEIGSMTVTQQVDAIRALGTNPMNKLILPKIIATTISAPILTMMANFLGIVGGMMIASAALGLSAFDYFFKAFEIITSRDVMGGVIKSIVFGFLIGLVGCCVGMRTRGGTQGVGNSTTQAVVMASILVLIFDFIVTQLIWIFEHAFTSGVV
jgi:phospholipid/cholesterol/gamma-HCH transport system permease protein